VIPGGGGIFQYSLGMTAMLVLRYTTAETSSVPIIMVLIILNTQCVLFEYPHKAKLVVCLRPVRFMDGV
jgi:hypothetical protein